MIRMLYIASQIVSYILVGEFSWSFGEFETGRLHINRKLASKIIESSCALVAIGVLCS